MTSDTQAITGKPVKIIAIKDRPDTAQPLRHVGGSTSDDWNHVIARQAIGCVWTKHLSPEDQGQQGAAVIAALAAIRPADELESMVAAQLIACHNAAMECFRRGMLGEQTFEGRKENLSQASKLSRSFTMLL